ncbi:PQQ-dependent sugar dehydrogenase [Psychrobacter arcticus]|nr:PQQ-dependent sugar dehydrogenase [Psychrobacter arcticus]
MPTDNPFANSNDIAAGHISLIDQHLFDWYTYRFSGMAWHGNALISGLSSKALIVVRFDENNGASERYRYDMGERIRSVLNVEGQVWVLEDGSE